MSQDNPDLDQRLARFEAQLDRFSLALHQWQQADGVAERASAVDVAQRMRTIEETLDREALALRVLHQEPLRQLQAQAANLSEICASAAQSVQGLDQAGSRLEAIQADVHMHLTDLSRALQALVADLRANTSTGLSTQGPPASWPLDRIVHLHDELRRGAADRDGAATAPDSAASSGSDGVRQNFLQAALDAEAAHGDGLAPTDEPSAPRRRPWILGTALLAAVSVLVFIVERRIESTLNDAGARVASAERQATAAAQTANQEIVAAREEANRQIAAARDSAQRAETVGAILTAPDLIRFSLTGGASVDRSSAQVLWSRTRGLVMSASRLPAAPPETIYQLWLKTSGDPVSGGIFVPDATGRATLVTDVPPKVSGPVLGAEVTIEPTGGRNAPSGRPLLVRYPPI